MSEEQPLDEAAAESPDDFGNLLGCCGGLMIAGFVAVAALVVVGYLL